MNPHSEHNWLEAKFDGGICMWFYSEDKDVIEHNMNRAKEEADSNLSKYHDTNEEEYLENYYKYQDDYKQYSWMLDK